ncbi:uncharacterized protein LOC107844941 [Capsicum annuum]|uniref:uncharacterized protein LOC107844941 n=1 Tax=Capsicum annuum TaxID=4072 RepID=UPI0007BFBA66|nr:uncharacterized protein LOC107844941 [Capsicum annuum]
MKVVLVLVLATLLFTADAFPSDAAEKCFLNCSSTCKYKSKMRCDVYCSLKCGFRLDTTDEVETQKHVCNVGCSLGHCYKFLIQNDDEKYESCMTSCSANYCIGSIALKKA